MAKQSESIHKFKVGARVFDIIVKRHAVVLDIKTWERITVRYSDGVRRTFYEGEFILAETPFQKFVRETLDRSKDG